VLGVLAGTLVVTAVAGAIYEQLAERRDRARLPQVGRSVDIGGRTLDIFCSGKGAPTVILDSGNGEPGYAWSHIQPAISTFTRACWFDRAGLGWSEPGPFPRTAAASSRDLHELLRRSGIPGPFVLVGHSLGGLNARVYAGMYPEDVAGMVLVDAAHEDEPRRAPQFMLGRTAPRWLWHPIWIAAQSARAVGLLRLTTPVAQLSPRPDQRTREEIVRALRQQPKSVAALFGDASSPDSYAQAESVRSIGDRPLIVLTRGKVSVSAHPTAMDREAAAYEQVWMNEIQPKLARLSTRGRQIIIERSGHGIPEEAPEAIVDAIREVVEDVRGARAPST
jgi:pimeloyl-ACP methyl ester carboxylesterase